MCWDPSKLDFPPVASELFIRSDGLFPQEQLAQNPHQISRLRSRMVFWMRLWPLDFVLTGNLPVNPLHVRERLHTILIP